MELYQYVLWAFPVVGVIWTIIAFVQDTISYKPGISKLKPIDVWYIYVLIPYIYCGLLVWDVARKLLNKKPE
jgi:hypothetical protein